MHERIKQIMARVFEMQAEEVPDSASASSLTKWDSLGHIELMLALEMELEIELTSDEMLELLSLEAIERYVSQRVVEH